MSGLSGAGKSTALHALEDLGFFCIDNLPVPVMSETLVACEAGGVRRVALGIDVRVRKFLERAGEVIDAVRIPGQREVEVLFLDATDETLLRRFSSTRRPHPLVHALGPDSTNALAVLVPVLEGIVGWPRPQIRQFFESYGFLIQEWDRVRTDWLTLRPASTDWPQATSVN